MTTHPHETHPGRAEVSAFVDQVRAGLGDLAHDEREELLDGLEADLAEQHADGGALPDPTTYVAELRVAAGLPAAPLAGRSRPLGLGAASTARLDAARAWWARQTDSSPGTRQAWELAVAVRPAWWVLRAWVAVTWLDQALGAWEPVSLVPHLAVPLAGPAVLLAAVVLSVLVGQRRLWPGTDRRAPARVLLLGLNLLALVVPLGFATASPGWDQPALSQPVPDTRGVLVEGRRVANIYPYDAQGTPLSGVQLFDGAGRPIALRPGQAQAGGAPGSGGRVVGCPWLAGSRVVWNVFPLTERTQPGGTCLDRAPQAGAQAPPVPPLAVVPPVVSQVAPTPPGG